MFKPCYTCLCLKQIFRNQLLYEIIIHILETDTYLLTLKLQGFKTVKVANFKYLRSNIQSKRFFTRAVKKRGQVGRNGWRQMPGEIGNMQRGTG